MSLYNSHPDQEKGTQLHVENAKHTSEYVEHADSAPSSILAVHDDPVLTRKLLWKLDLRILPMLALLFLFSFLDRYVDWFRRLAGSF